MNVADAIRTKRAVRQFADRPLSEEAVRAVLNAGRRAQSSKNTQPWHFVAVRDKATLQSLSECGNFAGHIAGAALAVVVLTPDPAQRWSIMFDAGQSAAYMQLAAWELGIGSCLATIYEPEKVRALLGGIPAEQHVNVAISFGHPAPDQVRPAVVKKGGRRPLEDVVHWERW
jgi:nitroreductase